MFRRQEPSAIYCRTAHNSRRTFGEVHQGSKCRRHIGDRSAMFPTCSRKHRQCIFDVIVSPMVWVIHRRCYRTALRSIDDAMAMLPPACSISYLHLVIRQQNKSDFFFIHDLIRQPQGMWFHVKSLHLLYALHKALYHCQDITITPPAHLQYSSVARRRITDHRRFYKYIVNC